MKRIIFLYLLILSSLSIYSQKKSNDYFSLHKGGKKYLKPIKYIKFSPKIDVKKITGKDIYFYIKGERFKFSENKHKIDTCDVNIFKNIKFSEANKLSSEEFIFHNQKIKESSYWKNRIVKPPMPLTRIHNYFKVFIIEENESVIIKHEVDWEHSH